MKPKIVNLKGEHLKKKIADVVNAMLYDPETTPGQINVACVAKRVGCSRPTIYKLNMASVVRLAQEKKERSAQYEEKLKKARKPRLIKLQDRVRELMDEVETLKAEREKLDQLFTRFIINVQMNMNKYGIEQGLDEMLSKEVAPLEARKHEAYARGKKEQYMEGLVRLIGQSRAARGRPKA